MEKEFIPYEQALSLKELGFNERPCFATWIERDKRDGGGIVIEMWGDEDTEYNVISEILAPTFSQAFRWFRQKLSLCGEIYTVDMGAIDYSFQIRDLYSEDIIHDNFKANTGGYFGTFNSYEEAELECLKELIEIVKRK